MSTHKLVTVFQLVIEQQPFHQKFKIRKVFQAICCHVAFIDEPLVLFHELPLIVTPAKKSVTMMMQFLDDDE